MPLYEYECKSCDEVVEVLVRSPEEKVACPTCADTKLIRVFSVTATPAMAGGNRLPVAEAGESCGAPRCCGGGGCQS